MASYFLLIGKHLSSLLFAAIVCSISVLWIFLSQGSLIFFPIFFGLFLLLAKFLATARFSRYLFAGIALVVLFIGQITSPTDFRYFLHIAFNIPIVFAFLFPEIFAGALVTSVLVYLVYFSGIQSAMPFDLIAGPMIGIVIVSVFCYSISYLIHRLLWERVNLRKKIQREYEEKEKVQQEMARFDRLNLIGEMAASIGHEVRNPLTTVRGYLQLFQRNKAFANYGERFEIMISELDRANEIITKFLTLAKNKSIQLKPDNISEIINSILPLLQADAILLGRVLQTELGDVPDLLVDENEIRQCIINLVKNGFEATGKEGIVTIRTAVQDEAVVLTVQDNGRGMPSPIYEKLGTPFVTTKVNGNGLGLAVCYRIAQRHNATIEVHTSSAGTSFRLHFKIPRPT